MYASGTPRFRIRDADGAEYPVASVADLSSYVEKGRVGNDTPLYDAGTGQWARAGSVPVFQFVVEELRAEGRLPAGFDEAEVLLPPDPPPEAPIDPGQAFEPIRHGPGETEGERTSTGAAGGRGDEGQGSPLDVGALPEGSDLSRATEASGPGVSGGETGIEPEPAGLPPIPPTVDPFELHLPLSGRERVAEPAPEGEEDPEAPAGTEAEREPWFEDRHPPASTSASMVDPSSGAAPPATGTTEVEPGTDPEAPATREPALDDDPGPAPRVDREAPVLEGRTDHIPGAEASPPPDPEVDASPLHTWLVHGPPSPGSAPASGGGLPGDRGRDRGRDPAEADDAEEVPGGAERSGGARASVSAGGPSAGGRAGEAGSAPVPPLEIRTAWEDSAEAADPRALHLAARRRKRQARLLATAAAVLVLVVGSLAVISLLRDGRQTASAERPVAGVEGGDGALAVVPDPQEVQPPAGLEEAAERIWAALPDRLSARIDSLRVAHGIDEAPPRDWLSGYYLANAGEFAQVVTFWENYAAFVRDLAASETDLIQVAALDVLRTGTGDVAVLPDPRVGSGDEAGASAEAEASLLAYVAAREGRTGPVRRDRYLHLERTALAALQLHTFLVENQAFIAWSPAVGQGVSVDPVLEAVTDSPEVRRQLERHLDRVFEALDRTRGGGQPSLAGLRAELFGSLGRPL